VIFNSILTLTLAYHNLLISTEFLFALLFVLKNYGLTWTGFNSFS